MPVRDVGLIPGSRRSPGGGHGNPRQDSCLESPVDGGAWQALAHTVAKSRTRLKRLSLQGPAVQHRHLYALLCNGLYRKKGILKRKKAMQPVSEGRGTLRGLVPPLSGSVPTL